MTTILGADVGGTKVALALFENCRRRPRLAKAAVFKRTHYEDFYTLLSTFCNRYSQRIDGAIIGVAGPVSEGEVQLTNLCWQISEEKLRALLLTERVRLINDVSLMAYGVLELRESQTSVLHPGKAPLTSGTLVVLAPGTGLGVAFLEYESDQRRVYASEGGHLSFAPQDEVQNALWQCLRARYSRVSYERVLSGEGLQDIYHFLSQKGLFTEPAELKVKLAESEDPAAVIGVCGVKETYPICSEAVRLFCEILCSFAGDLALLYLPSSGVFLGGGIPRKLISVLHHPDHVQAFLNKGRMSHLLQDIRLSVMVDENCALLGAAALGKALWFN